MAPIAPMAHSGQVRERASTPAVAAASASSATLSERVANGTPAVNGGRGFEGFSSQIAAILPADRVITDPLRLVTLGTDASCYRLTPRMILLVEDEAEVVAVVEAAGACGVPLTFRAAGTSLSGQAVTNSVLVKLGPNGWRNWEVNDDATLLRVEPGLTGAQANARLVRHGRKIGPDPASIASAMIGGIAANNASGMCCGVAQNSYQTLESMRVVLSDGAVLDTGNETSRNIFRQSHAPLLNALGDLAARTRADMQLSARIAKKFKIKNTMGYAINALIDYHDPIDILQHLMIGSEGTLGFISEITYRTVPDPRHKSTALAFFPSIQAACEAVARLKHAPVAAVELMDHRALLSVRDNPGMPQILFSMPEGTAALLIEVHGATPEEADANALTSGQRIASIQTLEPVHFTRDPEKYALYWKIRKGTFPAVGAVRAAGTTVIIEDVAVTTEQLASAVLDLQALFARHRYDEAIIFGHALEGNVHFVFTQGFSSQSDIDRYAAFMDDVTDLIVSKYDGSLKAEHSTGRNMAPFVEMEWGAQAYGLMREIKSIFDPGGILNPGVVLTDDQQAHLKNLKAMPPAHGRVDTCIECGFCEATCPSRAVTLTPRQRITGLREIARLKGEAKSACQAQRQQIKALEEAYAYQAVDTCAGDSLCAIACPVGIDTGEAMRELRHTRHGLMARFVAGRIANNFGLVALGIRVGLLAAGAGRAVIGEGGMARVMGAMHWASRGLVPKWTPAMPTVSMPMTRLKPTDREAVVFFPSCASRVFGPAPDAPDRQPLPDVVQNLLVKAGYDVVLPSRLEHRCCGMPFNSQGFLEVGARKRDELVRALKKASRNGEAAIVFDTSPCAHRVKQVATQAGLRVFDVIEALDELVLDRVELEPEDKSIALHATCSARKMGLDARLERVARRLALDVVVPDDIQCCGFAGDKGFTVPELNASALRHLSQALPERCAEGYSSSRTCEIGLSEHGGRPYQSIAYLADRCARSRDGRDAKD